MAESKSPYVAGSWRWLRWRLVVLVVVFTVGVVALCSGVQLSDREGIPEASLLSKIYYVLGLFVFGGLDLGTPTGGSPPARIALWGVYFAAPAITTSALVESLLLAVRPHAWRLRRIRGHVVIAGCGRLALLYMQRLREADRKCPIVLVEKHAGNPHVEFAARRYRAHVFHGDISQAPMLEALRLPHARRLVLLTGDDHANLDAAARAAQIAPSLADRTVVHVSDIRLLRVMEHKGILPQVSKFNSYRTAAEHLVQDRLLPHFKLTVQRDAVVLAGFGRFGQTVLAELQVRAQGRFGQVVIVDLEADVRAKVFRDQIGFSEDYDRSVINGDLRHPSTWERIAAEIERNEKRTVIVLGTGDDGNNVRNALNLSTVHPGATVFARCFESSSFTDQISKECGFEVVSTADLLLENIHADWLTN